ncbi:MAG TPA: iron ABC transporter permease [Alphaproteobacteria bacterium]|jgi:iron(III) transport system permease protein
MAYSDNLQRMSGPNGSGGLVARVGRWMTPTNILLVLCAVVAAWLVLVPLAALFYTAFAEDTPYGPGAFTLQNFVDVLTDRYFTDLFVKSVIFAGGTAVVTFALGTVVAWVVERTDAPGRGWFHGFALLSFAVPGLLTTMAWILILSPNIGWLNGELKAWFGLDAAPFNIYTMTGMVWALSSHYFPLAYLLMGPAFRVLDTRMEEAAVMSGANNFEVATRVTMPLLRPAILSTLLLLFIRGMESFEVPRLLGLPARIFVFTTQIQSATSNSPPQFGLAGAQGIILLIICVIGVFLYRRSTRHAEAFATITGKGYQPTTVRLGVWRLPVAIAMGLMFFLALGLPLFTLVWQSFFHNVTLPTLDTSVWSTMSWENYQIILHYPIFLGAVKNSVMLGAMAATIVVLFTFVMAWIAHRAAKGYGWILDTLTFVPIAIPSIIIGASILFAYLVIPIHVYNTIWILLIAYVTMNLPYGMRFTSSGIMQIHKELEEVAQMSGANLLQIFQRVLLPLLAPVLIAAWLYIFVLAVRELSASIFLSGPGTNVLGTISLTMWEEGGSFGAICALGVIQILPLIAIVMAMRWIEMRVGKPR